MSAALARTCWLGCTNITRVRASHLQPEKVGAEKTTSKVSPWRRRKEFCDSLEIMQKIMPWACLEESQASKGKTYASCHPRHPRVVYTEFTRRLLLQEVQSGVSFIIYVHSLKWWATLNESSVFVQCYLLHFYFFFFFFFFSSSSFYSLTLTNWHGTTICLWVRVSCICYRKVWLCIQFYMKIWVWTAGCFSGNNYVHILHCGF